MNKPTLIQVRIIKAPQSNDGWIAKELTTGKVGFITNLNNTLLLLRPGQIWDARIEAVYDKYDQISLQSLVAWKATPIEAQAEAQA